MESIYDPKSKAFVYMKKSVDGMKISVLMSVYIKEKPEFLDMSLKSLYGQSVKPNQIVLVEDGALTPALHKVILRYKKLKNIKFETVKLKKSKGLGPALNAGLTHCRFNWVARMDSDDVCHRNRFKIQKEFILKNKNVSLVGGYIAEFNDEITNVIGIRKVPLTKQDVRSFSKFRNPMNHMTVLFNKTNVMKIGGYMVSPFLQDYDLWIRMLSSGFEVRNIPEVLVWARFNENSLERRRGIVYLRQEIDLFKLMHSLGYINTITFVFNVLSRIFTRLIPLSLLLFVYRRFLRHKNFSSELSGNN